MVFRVLLAAVLAAGLASAQRGGGGKGGSKGGGDMGDMGMSRARQTKLDVIGEKIKLSKEQKDEVTKIFDNAQEKSAPLNEQIRNERNHMAQLLMNGKNSGPEWDTEMTNLTAMLAQRETVEADAYQKLYTGLDEKQKSKAAPVFEELMADMFAGSSWKRGGGMGGGMMGGGR
jgi:hypothetical protein